jgi:hypothetical protein
MVRIIQTVSIYGFRVLNSQDQINISEEYSQWIVGNTEGRKKGSRLAAL